MTVTSHRLVSKWPQCTSLSLSLSATYFARDSLNNPEIRKRMISGRRAGWVASCRPPRFLRTQHALNLRQCKPKRIVQLRSDGPSRTDVTRDCLHFCEHPTGETRSLERLKSGTTTGDKLRNVQSWCRRALVVQDTTSR